MSTVEALDLIERKAHRLNLKDQFGDELEPTEALAVVWRFHSDRWDILATQLDRKEISIDKYMQECFKLIDDYWLHTVNKKIGVYIQ